MGQLNDAIPQGFGYCLAAAIHMELGVDIPDMTPYRIDADMTIPGDHPFINCLSTSFSLSVR
jgi:hypothetical protein